MLGMRISRKSLRRFVFSEPVLPFLLLGSPAVATPFHNAYKGWKLKPGKINNWSNKCSCFAQPYLRILDACPPIRKQASPIISLMSARTLNYLRLWTNTPKWNTPRNGTHPWKRRNIYKPLILGFHVKFREGRFLIQFRFSQRIEVLVHFSTQTAGMTRFTWSTNMAGKIYVGQCHPNLNIYIFF